MKVIFGQAKNWLALAVAVGAAIAMAIVVKPRNERQHSIAEIKKIAEENRLFVVLTNDHDLVGGAIRFRKVIISRKNLSDDELERLVFPNQNDAIWRDTIVVMRPPPSNTAIELNPPPDDILGQHYVYGDTSLIKAIKALLANDAHRK